MQPQPPTPPLTPTHIPTYYPSVTPPPPSSINATNIRTNNAMNNPLHANNLIHSTNDGMNNQKKKKVIKYYTRSQTKSLSPTKRYKLSNCIKYSRIQIMVFLAAQGMAPNAESKHKAKVLKKGFDLFECYWI